MRINRFKVRFHRFASFLYQLLFRLTESRRIWVTIWPLPDWLLVSVLPCRREVITQSVQYCLPWTVSADCSLSHSTVRTNDSWQRKSIHPLRLQYQTAVFLTLPRRLRLSLRLLFLPIPKSCLCAEANRPPESCSTRAASRLRVRVKFGFEASHNNDFFH